MALPPQDFTGYEPGQVPGSYVFQRRGGPPLSFGGPLAERLKQQLDEAAGPDMRVAGPGGGRRNVTQADIDAAAAERARKAPVAAPPVAGGRRNVTPEDVQKQAAWRGSAPAEQAKRAEEQKAHDAEWAKRDAAAQAQAAPAAAEGTPPAIAAPAQPAGPRVLAATKGNGRMYQDPSGEIRVRSGGSPGVSHAQLEAKVPLGVNTPSKTETIREGAAGGDPDYLENMANVSIDERLLNMQSAARQANAASEEALAYGEAAAAAQKRVELENKTAQRMKEETQRAELEYNSARDEYRNAKIDPRRMFRGPGVIAAIGGMVASAVGAYAATIGHTENFAQKSIQASIDRDIEAQREEIRVKGNSANNALADLTRKMGDQKAAEAVLKSEQGEYAMNLLKARAAASKRPEIIEMAQRMDLAEQKRQIQLRDDYMKARQGKITEKVMGEFAYPKAGSGPTDRPARLDELEQYEDYQGKRLANTKTDQEIQNGGSAAEITDPVRKEAAQLATTKGRLESIASSHGYTIDPATGKVTAGDGAGFPSRLSLDRGKRAKFEVEATQLGRDVAGVLNPGSEPGQPLVEKMTPDPNAMDASIAATIEADYQRLLEAERNLGISEKQRAILDQRQRSANVQRAQRAGNPLPAPVPVR